MILTTGKDGILGMNNANTHIVRKELNVHKNISIKGPLSYNYDTTNKIGDQEFIHYNKPKHWTIWLGYNEYIVMKDEASCKKLFKKIANYLD